MEAEVESWYQMGVGVVACYRLWGSRLDEAGGWMSHSAGGWDARSEVARNPGPSLA
jgi:hypothetical protein